MGEDIIKKEKEDWQKIMLGGGGGGGGRCSVGLIAHIVDVVVNERPQK